MKKKLKRILSALLVAVMLVGIAPIGGIDLSVKSSAMDLSSYNVGDLIEFGSYPQSKVTDSTLISKLETEGSKYKWIDYNYYAGTGEISDGNMKPVKDMMLYKDIPYGGNKYRAVKINQYRPIYTGYISSSSNSFQDDNGYYIKNVYYFKYEPLKWRVLDASTGLVVCDSIIDSQPYNNYILKAKADDKYWGDSGQTYYASNWENSSLRAWLNNEFYNTAFSEMQQDRIKELTRENKSTLDSKYDSNPTSDKITLLSYNDVLNTSYGFSSYYNYDDTARLRKSSDYVQCQGGTSSWWLRSSSNSYYASGVNNFGWANYYYYHDVNMTYYGVVPALNLIDFLDLQPSDEDVVSPTGTKVTILEKKQYVRIGGTEMSKVPGGQGAGNTAVCIFKDRISEGDFNNSDFVWTSGDDTILKVTGSSYDFLGNTAFLKVNVLGVSDGTTTLTVTTSDGAKSTCVVNVTNKLTDEDSLLDEEALPANAKIICGKYSDYIITSVINGDKTYISDVIIDGTTYATEKNFMNGKELDSMKNQNVVAIQVDGKITEMNTLDRYISTKLSTNAIGGLGYKENEKYPIEVYFQNSLSSRLKNADLSRFNADTTVKIKHIEMFVSNGKGGKTRFYTSDIDKTIALKNSVSLAQTELKMKLSYVNSDGFAYITIIATGEKNGKSVSYSSECKFQILNKDEFGKISESTVKGDNNSEKAKTYDKEIANVINANAEKLKLEDTIAWNASLNDFLNDSQLNALGYAMVGTIVMSEAPKQTFEEYLTDKILDKLKVAHKISVGLFSVEVPMYVRVKSPKYGMLEIKFTANATNYTLSGNKFGTFGNVDYEIVGGSGMSKVPENNRKGLAGVIAYADINAFAEGMYNVAMAEIKKAYNLGYGNDFNKVCDVFFNDTIVDMLLKSCKKDYKDAFFDIMSYPATKYRGSCPIEMRVYDKDGKLCAFASDEKVVSIDENVECELDGHTKIVTISGWNIDDYKVEISATGNGKMNLAIDDVAGSCRVMRTQIFNDYMLTNGGKYEFISGDILLDSKSKIVYNGKSTMPTDDIIYDFRTIEEENVNSVSVSDITLNYKKSATIKPTIKADEGTKYTVKYSSSNTKVATVDNNGKVYAAKKGSATITCTVTDSNGNTVQDTCKVTVKYSFGQWLIKILLFGWIWY